MNQILKNYMRTWNFTAIIKKLSIRWNKNAYFWIRNGTITEEFHFETSRKQKLSENVNKLHENWLFRRLLNWKNISFQASLSVPKNICSTSHLVNFHKIHFSFATPLIRGMLVSLPFDSPLSSKWLLLLIPFVSYNWMKHNTTEAAQTIKWIINFHFNSKSH